MQSIEQSWSCYTIYQIVLRPTFSGTALKLFSQTKRKISEQASPQVATEKPRVCKHAGRRNLRHCDVSRDENPPRENEIDSPSSEGFHAQLDCKLIYDNENQTHLTLVKYIQFRVKEQNKTKQKNKNKNKQTKKQNKTERMKNTGKLA